MSQSPSDIDRRRLPKSKTGCRTCKKRKVKCDESRPACQKCVKHGVKCDFVSVADANNTPQLHSPLHQHDVYNYGSEGFTVTDLELLHHYTTSVCMTISTEPLARSFWRINIPQIGFNTPFILKGILAVSALHLARYRPDRKEFYTGLAFQHHNAALAQASPLIANIDIDNGVNLFLFSTLTYFFSFAKPRGPTDFLLSENSAVPDWLYLFRGVRALIESMGSMLRTSSISFLFEEGKKIHYHWLSLDYDSEGFRELQTNIQSSVADDAKRDTLFEAIDSLKKSFALANDSSLSDGNRSRGVFVWLYKISDSFIDLVGAGDSEALCVLAFFCVLLRRLDYLWWIESWGIDLIERIYNRLNDTYKLWIRWPIEEVGWVPIY
ncbi:hypothetical protein KJ359_008773 [Pestalotiopsis sp. 9143b]|nr:hypothetical protein KJ359_008773 [Pestalotiopsis sp. 9143b]